MKRTGEPRAFFPPLELRSYVLSRCSLRLRARCSSALVSDRASLQQPATVNPTPQPATAILLMVYSGANTVGAVFYQGKRYCTDFPTLLLQENCFHPARFRPLHNGVHALARPKRQLIPLTRATASGGWHQPCTRTPGPETRRLGEGSNDAPS
jgi:hypothetical protein